MDKHQTQDQFKQEKTCDKFLRECGLLAGMVERMPGGIIDAVDDAIKHPEQSAFSVGMSAAVGVGLAVLTRNPGLVGKAAVPCLNGVLKALPYLAGITVSYDMGQRLGEPVRNTWESAANFETNKILLADKMGKATVDYALMGFGGLAGAKFELAATNKFVFNLGELAKPQNDLAFACASGSPKQIDANVLNPTLKGVENNELVLLMKGFGYEGFSKASIRGPVKIGSNPTQDIVPASGEGNVILYPHPSDKFACAKIFSNGRWHPLDLLKILNVKDTKFSNGKSEMLESLAQSLQKLEKVDLVLKQRTQPPAFEHFTLEHAELPISGKVTIDRANLKPTAPEKGDVYIGIVTNVEERSGEGIPGYLYTKIFDGNSWQSLNVANFRGQSNWEFQAKSSGKLEATAKSIKEHIVCGKDKTVSWTQGSKMFRFQ